MSTKFDYGVRWNILSSCHQVIFMSIANYAWNLVGLPKLNGEE